MWVFEVIGVICAKHPFLHSLNVLIKMFTNSLAVLNQQTLGMTSLAVLNQQTLGITNHTHCFQTQLIESCVVDWF